MRQIHTSIDTLVEALIPEYAHHHVVITPDDFDRDDSWGPGEYEWIDVADDVADRWDIGLAACTEHGVRPLSREGVELRWTALHGDAPLPVRLTEWLDQRDREAAEQAAADTRRRRAEDSYRAHLAGYTNLGTSHPRAYEPDVMTAEVALEHPSDADTIVEQVRQLGMGSYAVLWSRDRALIDDARERSRITGYSYAPDLFAALIALERDGVTLGSLGSWFGGTWGLDTTSCVVRTCSSHRRTGTEKEHALRGYLDRLLGINPDHSHRIRSVINLVAPGTITHTTVDSCSTDFA